MHGSAVVLAGTGGVETGCIRRWDCLVITRSNTMVSKALSVNRPHKPMVKLTGKRDTGNPYVAFDVAGAGNVVMKTRQLSTLPVRGVEINVYSTHITSQSFFRLVNILACHAEDREYKFRRPRHLSYILSSLIGFFIAHLTI